MKLTQNIIKASFAAAAIASGISAHACGNKNPAPEEKPIIWISQNGEMKMGVRGYTVVNDQGQLRMSFGLLCSDSNREQNKAVILQTVNAFCDQNGNIPVKLEGSLAPNAEQIQSFCEMKR